jgi:2-C-methyl-D-erythritol 4-phosphate cytidylyltransferase/2-C-methyl-D-erythritol 2,4-cyclodiphosphate synthase
MRTGAPKQFQLLGGRPMLAWSVSELVSHPAIASVIILAPPDQMDEVRASILGSEKTRIIAGGATRTQSVANGLASLDSEAWDHVLIHDAARPGLSHAVIDELLEALTDADAACPALPILDALKEVGPDGGLTTVDRTRHMRVQTPQAFRFSVIRDAYRHASGDQVDDLALVEAAGARIVLTPGRQELMKVTEPGDMALAAKLLGTTDMRIGSGFDVHAFEPGAFVTLCGVRVPHTHKLKGHSDADAGWHALTDAILGALALGDIGDHFPPSDPRWKGVDSIVFLQHAVKLATERGLRIANADLTLICERPKIGPHREAMRARTAEAMGVAIACVSVKATTTEKLGFTGREEGIAAQAVVLLAP